MRGLLILDFPSHRMLTIRSTRLRQKASSVARWALILFIHESWFELWMRFRDTAEKRIPSEGIATRPL